VTAHVVGAGFGFPVREFLDVVAVFAQPLPVTAAGLAAARPVTRSTRVSAMT
jgi:hypothetical protein